jgi:hypothetical protein
LSLLLGCDVGVALHCLLAAMLDSLKAIEAMVKQNIRN